MSSEHPRPGDRSSGHGTSATPAPQWPDNTCALNGWPRLDSQPAPATTPAAPPVMATPNPLETVATQSPVTPPAPVATSAPDDSGRPTGDGHAAAARTGTGTRVWAVGVARVAAGTCAALASVLVSALVSVVVLVAGLGHLVGPHGGAGGVPAPVLAALVGFPPTPAADVLAAPGEGTSGISLNQFLDNARNLAVSLLGTVTIFFLSVGFLRLLAARGEADEVEKGKAAIKAGVLGFIGVMLAPAVVGVLQTLTGGAGPAA